VHGGHAAALSLSTVMSNVMSIVTATGRVLTSEEDRDAQLALGVFP